MKKADVLLSSVLEKLKIVLYVFVAIILVAVIGSAIFYNIDIASMLRFLYTVVVWVWGPGALLVYLAGRRQKMYGFWTLSFAMGIIFVSVLFAVSKYFSFNISLTQLGPLMTMFFIYLYIQSGNSPKTLWRTMRLVSPFWAIGIVLSGVIVLIFFLANPPPLTVKGFYAYSADFMWTVSNIEAFLREFPPSDSRISDVLFKYHYLSMLYRAFLCNQAAVGSFEIATFFYPISNTFFLVFALRFLAVSFFNKNTALASLIFTALTLMTTCASSFFNLTTPYGKFFNVFTLHIFQPTHGFELSLPLFLISIGMTCRVSYWTSIFRTGIFLIMFLLSFATTVAKGPVGLLLSIGAFALFAVTIINLALHKATCVSGKASLLFFLACVVGFLSAFFSLLSTGGASTLFWQPGWLAWKTFGNERAYSLSYVSLIPVHLVGFSPVGFSASLMWLFMKKRAVLMNCYFAAILTASLAGIGMAYLLSHYGMSNLYFLMAVVPCLNLLGTDWLVENYGSMRWGTRFFWGLCIVLAFSSFLCTVVYYGERGVRTGYNIFKQQPMSSNYVPSRDEYLALQWIAENTSPKSLLAGEKFWIADDKTYPVSNSRFFYYSVFGKRQVYLEGWGYSRYAWFVGGTHPEIQRRLNVLDAIFNNINDSRALMQQQKIDYIIVDKTLRPNFHPANLKCVFDNRGAAVFSIHE